MKLLWDKMMWFRRWMLALHPGGAKAAKWELTTPVAFAAGMLGMLGSPAWDIMDSYDEQFLLGGGPSPMLVLYNIEGQR
jgi:hypothetical protein